MIGLHDFYASLVESADDAIVAKDANGIVIAWNRAAERLFGYSAEEMEGHSIRRLLPPDRAGEEDAILERIHAGERVGQFFTRRLHKSGRLVDVSVSVSPVRDESGTIVGASKIARDVGPMLANQHRLRESERRFRMLADNISQFAWIARADGHMEWFNKRWHEYTGATTGQSQGWGWTSLVHPSHRARVEARLREAVEKEEDWEDTFLLRGAGGEYRWFLSRAMPIREVPGHEGPVIEGLFGAEPFRARAAERPSATDSGAGDESGAGMSDAGGSNTGAGEIVYWFGTNTDITEQREQAEQIRLLLMEVNHRSKNMLSTVQALARRTAPGESGFIARFEDRVRSLAVNQDILVRRAWREVPVSELVAAQLSFLSALGEVKAEGPDCALTPRAAEVIGMALHELATNALKYGALSGAGGRVDIGWSRLPDGRGFSIWWEESGGPAVQQPDGHGFGTTLIRDVPRHNLSAEVELDYAESGLRWALTCDARVLVGHESNEGAG